MIKPKAIHKAAACRVAISNDTIIAVQTNIPRIGTSGTNGVLNGLFNSGLLFRMIRIPKHTKMKANKVPKDVKSPATLPGTNAAKAPTKMKSIQLAM